MYSFPYTKPVTADTMNYVSAVYGVILVIIFTDWFARGKRNYRGQDARKQEIEGIIRRESVTTGPAMATGVDGKGL